MSAQQPLRYKRAGAEMIVKSGARLRSSVCETEVVVIRAPQDDLAVACGGKPMVAMDGPAAEGAPEEGWDSGSLLGKRYVSADDAIELLCTKAGSGSLGLGDTPFELKGAKPLPSSD
jgi:hypothetical protein